MMREKLTAVEILEGMKAWTAPTLLERIPHGDMPGDKVEIGEIHRMKAESIFPKLCELLKTTLTKQQKAVVAVCGGSGVGKSEIASLLAFYLNEAGISTYTLSGDNYPHRIPLYNDAERLRVFRESALRGMVQEGTYSKERFDVIRKLQEEGRDADISCLQEFPWFASYIRNGKNGLLDYLGTEQEIGFGDIAKIVEDFKNGAEKIWLKRMGRTDTEMWFDEVDFSEMDIIIIEWTHGNSDNYTGVDIPILLNSTPKETLEHRRARNRDGAPDSPFVTLVLTLEQELLRSQAHKAKIICAKNGELLTFAQYEQQMEECYE